MAHWVLDPPGADEQGRCAAGAPGLAPWVPHPLRALTILRNASGALLAHWESKPLWAAGDTPHLMPVEQGLPWHPPATGLAGETLPCVVAAPHAHALPSSTFWFPVPAASPAST